MDDDREAFEFAFALYQTQEIDRETAQLIVDAAEVGLIGIEQATGALWLLDGPPNGLSTLSYSKLSATAAGRMAKWQSRQLP